jgi:4a-hydroxytetrahydrobiopterin dehydratase
MALLSDIEIQRELSTLAGWSRKGNEITKTFQFDGFPAAVSFVQAIVPLAEGMNHHPDVDVRYNRVIIRLSTHDQGGVTKKDLSQARKIEELALAKPPGK